MKEPIGWLLTVDGKPGFWDGFQIVYANTHYRGAGVHGLAKTKAGAEKLMRQSLKNRRAKGWWDKVDYWRVPVYLGPPSTTGSRDE